MNQLKFYIEFSGSMSLGSAYKYVKLYRMPETYLESEAFIKMPEELWDPERKRLTIFFDPGRIKRGVQPNLQLGLPLVQGRSYKLVIEKEWKDSQGTVLCELFEKEFQVTEVDRKSPQPEDWQITWPKIASKEPLKIDFGEAMDYGLLHSAIAVIDSQGDLLEGQIKVTSGETEWHFTPSKPWSAGHYQLAINAWLEDLAGNNLKRKFDVDLYNDADTPKDFDELLIPFKISEIK